MQSIITGLIISYLVGSIPTAYLFARIFKGIDIRKHGSGNVGATNAIRVLGKTIGICVLIIDVLKGFVVVLFLADRFSGYEWFKIAVGFASVCGHNWPVFLRFKGGKGVATSLGVLLGLALSLPVIRPALGLSFLIWLLVYILSKYRNNLTK